MLTKLIVNQIVRLIGSFPSIAIALPDGKKRLEVQLEWFINVLINENIMHIARVESDQPPAILSPYQLTLIEANLMTLVNTLIGHPEDKNIPDDDSLTECESLFITLYKVLRAFEKYPPALQVMISRSKAPTAMLVMQAAHFSTNMSSTGNDQPYDALTYKKLYERAANTKHCNMAEWNALSTLILATLEIVTPAYPDNFNESQDTQELLTIFVKHGRLDKITQLMRHDELGVKTAIVTDTAKLLHIALDEKYFHMARYLLGIYKQEEWCNVDPKGDLTTPASKQSLLGLAVHHLQWDIAEAIMYLQGGIYFNKADRDFVISINNADWEDDARRKAAKPTAGYTLLHIAAKYNTPELMQPLVEQAGIKHDEKTYFTRATPWQVAKACKSEEAAAELEKIDKLKKIADKIKKVEGELKKTADELKKIEDELKKTMLAREEAAVKGHKHEQEVLEKIDKLKKIADKMKKVEGELKKTADELKKIEDELKKTMPAREEAAVTGHKHEQEVNENDENNGNTRKKLKKSQ